MLMQYQMEVKPQKVEIHSQRELLHLNRQKRAQVLKAIQEITLAQREIATAVEFKSTTSKK
ncbi:hypothetical protein [Paenibacillus sp. NAIST15-1]|uniref:hypothetical protein n=1 Tax=Paenibacillus sp. NAIST15-1 TaxID=1605994 RepID=UPI00086993F8|nr:hypothetical protein [Paenibacillus sp. NAIST15-1]GAV10717.1 DNA-directed RNA polymerase subunit beta [Paenibacillus sp. NAIST15-1]